MDEQPLRDDEREATDAIDERLPDDPTVATNHSNIGTLSGSTGPTPLSGIEIELSTTDDPEIPL